MHQLKIYLDNSCIGLLYEIRRKYLSGGPLGKQEDAEALKKLLKMRSIKHIASEDSYAESRKKMKYNEQKIFKEIHDEIQFVSLQHRIPLDGTYRFGHGVTYGGPYPEIKGKIESFLAKLTGFKKRGNYDDYDARELANCYQNNTDYFVTIDIRTIIKFKKEIEKEFGIKVIRLSELLEKLIS